VDSGGGKGGSCSFANLESDGGEKEGQKKKKWTVKRGLSQPKLRRCLNHSRWFLRPTSTMEKNKVSEKIEGFFHLSGASNDCEDVRLQRKKIRKRRCQGKIRKGGRGSSIGR